MTDSWHSMELVRRESLPEIMEDDEEEDDDD